MFKNILRTISITDITLLQDIKKDLFINKNSKASYYNCNKGDLFNFILMLQSNSLYSVVPMLTIQGKSNKPYMVLSPSILVTKYSNIRVITNFLDDKYQEGISEFNIENQENIELVIKYRKILLDFDQINKKLSKH